MKISTIIIFKILRLIADMNDLLEAIIISELKSNILYCLAWLAVGAVCSIIGCIFSWVVPVVLVSGIYWYSVKDPCPSPDEIKKRKDTFVIIVGSGYSGLTAAIRLKQVN